MIPSVNGKYERTRARAMRRSGGAGNRGLQLRVAVDLRP